jgi:hypothetical protein
MTDIKLWSVDRHCNISPQVVLKERAGVSETYTISGHPNVLRVHAKLDERFAFSDPIRMVELENENGHTTLWRERHDPCAFQPEVVAPLMVARMKE